MAPSFSCWSVTQSLSFGFCDLREMGCAISHAPEKYGRLESRQDIRLSVPDTANVDKKRKTPRVEPSPLIRKVPEDGVENVDKKRKTPRVEPSPLIRKVPEDDVEQVEQSMREPTAVTTREEEERDSTATSKYLTSFSHVSLSDSSASSTGISTHLERYESKGKPFSISR
jgi:hypothetical protein